MSRTRTTDQIETLLARAAEGRQVSDKRMRLASIASWSGMALLMFSMVQPAIAGGEPTLVTQVPFFGACVLGAVSLTACIIGVRGWRKAARINSEALRLKIDLDRSR